jgi:ABC-type transport system involved in multi-copper enzyme maturation permease subunit
MRVIMSIATTTVGEAIRRKVLLVILMCGLLFLTVAPMLGNLTARQETSSLKGLMLAIIKLTGALIALVLTIYIIPNEIERRTIYTILSKPVQRWQFILGKYLGAVFSLGLMMLLMGVVLIVSFHFVQHGLTASVDFAELGDIAKGPLAYFMQASLLAAVAIFFSTFVTPTLNFFLAGGTYFVGVFLGNIYESFATGQGSVLMKMMAQIMYTVLPNFSYYDIQNPIINPGSEIRNEGMHLVLITLYFVLYAGILLVGSVLVFDKREV